MTETKMVAIALTAADRDNLRLAADGVSIAGSGFLASWRRLRDAGLVTRSKWRYLTSYGKKHNRPSDRGYWPPQRALTHSVCYNITAHGRDVLEVLRPDWAERYMREMDEDGYVPFNKDRRLGQNQYASRYATGKVGSANLGRGMRWKNLNDGCYHSILIHHEDLAVFHLRVEQYQDDVHHGRTPKLP